MNSIVKDGVSPKRVETICLGGLWLEANLNIRPFLRTSKAKIITAKINNEGSGNGIPQGSQPGRKRSSE